MFPFSSNHMSKRPIGSLPRLPSYLSCRSRSGAWSLDAPTGTGIRMRSYARSLLQLLHALPTLVQICRALGDYRIPMVPLALSDSSAIRGSWSFHLDPKSYQPGGSTTHLPKAISWILTRPPHRKNHYHPQKSPCIDRLAGETKDVPGVLSRFLEGTSWLVVATLTFSKVKGKDIFDDLWKLGSGLEDQRQDRYSRGCKDQTEPINETEGGKLGVQCLTSPLASRYFSVSFMKPLMDVKLLDRKRPYFYI